MAQPGDRSAVVQLCARAWPYGEDYVPRLWEEWLADAHGCLPVVEREHEIVAVAKVSFLAAHEAWLEGLRVDPAHRRRGLGACILGICLGQARQRGATVARLVTGSFNVAVHRMAARAGMDRVASFARYAAPPLPGASLPRAVSTGELAAVARLLADTRALEAYRGLYETSWCWPELSRERMAAAVRDGQVWGWAGPSGQLQAVALAGEETEGLDIGFLAGDSASLTALGAGLRALAAARGLPQAEALLPPSELLQAALAAAGFERGSYEDWVFEKRWP